MKKLLAAMFVALLMVGCETAKLAKIDLDDPTTLDKIIAAAIDDDKLQERGEKGEELYYAPNQQTPYTGWMKIMYDDGQIMALGQCKDGKLDGLRTYWHENGQKREEVNFKNGKRDGLGTWWYENGQKEAEGNMKDGKRDGLGTVWYENGQKESEGNFKDGLGTTWYEDGQKRSESTYKDGKLRTVVAWKPNGEKCPVTQIVDGDGVWVGYNEDGTERSRTTYKDGEAVID